MLALLLAVALDSFQTGEELHHQLTVCVFKASAEAIVDTDAKDGFEAAKRVYSADDSCNSLPVTGATVGKVVHTAKVQRDGKERTASVVEILVDGKPVAYFITSLPITGRVSVEPRRGSNS